MTDTDRPTYAERLAAEQAKREADRAERRARIPYNGQRATPDEDDAA